MSGNPQVTVRQAIAIGLGAAGIRPHHTIYWRALDAIEEALSRDAAPEPEWEYGLRRAEPIESGITWYVHTTSDTLDGVTAWKSQYDEVVRRRKAGPWEPLPVGGDDAES